MHIYLFTNWLGTRIYITVNIEEAFVLAAALVKTSEIAVLTYADVHKNVWGMWHECNKCPSRVMPSLLATIGNPRRMSLI